MREFFHGWRRKVGCVTLAIALAILAAAVRSRLMADALWFPDDKRQHQIIAADGTLYWRAHDADRPRWDVDSGYKPTAVVRLIDERRDATHLDDPDHPIEWRVPYWSLILPLTLLSACLILWKPRKRTEPYHA